MIFAKRTILDHLNVLQLGMVQQTYRFLNVVKKSIALNASDEVKRKASFSVDTDNLLDILDYIK